MRIGSIIAFLFIMCCSGKSDKFQAYNVDPITAAISRNKIKCYQTFFYKGDTTISFQLFTADKNGNLLEQESAKGILRNNRKMEYDSTGRMIRYIVDSDIYVDYTITYESRPIEKLVITKWFDKDFGIAYEEYIRYDGDLRKILRRTQTRFDLRKDTLYDYVYRYDLDKLMQVNNKNKLAIEYKYTPTGQLKEIHRIADNAIDYISLSTGLIDSTISANSKRELRTYYKYCK
jgi:hypothetical protein